MSLFRFIEVYHRALTVSALREFIMIDYFTDRAIAGSWPCRVSSTVDAFYGGGLRKVVHCG